MPKQSLRFLLGLAGFVCLVYCFGSPAWAQNEQEAVGFQENHFYDAGQFGEGIDILNGGLNLTIPIGPRYQVNSRLGYQFSLSYNSKIWNLR